MAYHNTCPCISNFSFVQGYELILEACLSCRNKKVCTPTKVDDRVGDKEITDMWRNHYSTLLNSVRSSIDKDRVLSYLVLVDILLLVFLLMMLTMVLNLLN